MIFKRTDYFEKRFKKLKKKYVSLEKDLEVLQKVLKCSPEIEGKHSNLITEKEGIKIRKIRLKCQFAKSSDFRVIYAYHQKTQEIEMINFLEIYAKNKQTNHNQSVIQDYLKWI